MTDVPLEMPLGNANGGVYEADTMRMAQCLQPIVDEEYKSPLKQIASKAMVVGFLLDRTKSEWVLGLNPSRCGRIVTLAMQRIGWVIHDQKRGRVVTFRKKKNWRPGARWRPDGTLPLNGARCRG